MIAAVPRLWLLWYAVLGGLTAWAVHLVGGYFALELVCDAGRGTPALALPFLIALTLIPAALAAGALIVATGMLPRARGWRRTFAFGGALLDAVSVITILLGATQLLVLAPCARYFV